jgi:hypothetical protein
VTLLENDLRKRCKELPEVDAPLRGQYEAAKAGKRTAMTYGAWLDEQLTQVAVAWVLACVFVRFLEDNGLVEVPKLAGPGALGQRARDEHELFFQKHPTLTEREYLEGVFTETGTLSYQLSRAVHGVLTNSEVSPRWSTRARQTMDSLRAEYAFLHSEQDVVFINSQSNETRWFTFAGGVINTALADAVRACGMNEVSSSDYLVKVTENTGARSLVDQIRQKTTDEIVTSFIVSDEFMEKLKFTECLPKRMVQELLRGRLLNHEDIRDTLGRAIVVVEEGA